MLDTGKVRTYFLKVLKHWWFSVMDKSSPASDGLYSNQTVMLAKSGAWIKLFSILYLCISNSQKSVIIKPI